MIGHSVVYILVSLCTYTEVMKCNVWYLDSEIMYGHIFCIWKVKIYAWIWFNYENVINTMDLGKSNIEIII